LIRTIVALISFFVLVSCASSRKIRSSLNESDVHFGVFEINSSDIDGSGTVIFKKNSLGREIQFYSSFGSKIYQLKSIGDSIFINEKESQQSYNANDTIHILSFSSKPFTAHNLFTILSGELPDSTTINHWEREFITSDQKIMTVRSQNEIKSIDFVSPTLKFTAKKRIADRFKSIKLITANTTYFTIAYE